MSALTLVIPAAGLGSRFRNVGVTTPKPLIPILEIPMLEWVIGNFKLESGDSLVIIGQVSESLKSKLDLVDIAKKVDLRFVEIDGLTDGPATTVTKAFPYINMKQPLIVANSDQYISADLQPFVDSVRARTHNGLILSMTATGNKWSYVGRDIVGKVVEVQEKVEISDEATVGVYAWSSGELCRDGITAQYEANGKVNNEFYVAPTYNYLLQQGSEVETVHIGIHGEDVHGVGTPEDLNSFLANPAVMSFKSQILRNLHP
jgi:NDP-sugar pyrophosphorylase family protein